MSKKILYFMSLLFICGIMLLSTSFVFAEEVELGKDLSEAQNGSITATYDTETKTITIKGAGRMKNLSTSSYIIAPSGGKIENIVFEEGITYIGRYTFRPCKTVKSISLPTTLEEIGDFAFLELNFGCSSSLEKISLHIPSNVSKIGEYAFKSCNIENLTFDEDSTLESIGDYSFDGNVLTSLVLPEGLKTIGECAFNNIYTLKSITLPTTLEMVGYHCFNCCSAVESFTCLSPKVDMGRLGLGQYREGSTANFGAEANSKTAYVLGEHTYLITALKTLGFTVNTQGEENLENFESFPSYYTIDMGAETPSNVKVYKNNYTHELYVKGSGRMKDFSIKPIPRENSYDNTEKIYFDEGISYIGKNAFKNSLQLVNSLSLPKSLEGVGDSAFYSMGSDLSKESQFNLTIPKSVSDIGQYAFASSNITSLSFEEDSSLKTLKNETFDGDTRLKTVALPKSLESIDNTAFSGCLNIKLFLNPSKNNQTLDTKNSSSWSGNFSEATSYCYKANSNFHDALSAKSGMTVYYIDDSVVSGTLETGVNWEFDPSTSTITFSGEGAIPDYTEGSQPWAGAFLQYGAAEKWVFNNTITNVGSGVICGIGGGSYGLGMLGYGGGSGGGGIGGGSGGIGGGGSGGGGYGPSIYAPSGLTSSLQAQGFDNISDVEDLNKPAETGIWNYVDDVEVSFPDVQPRIINGEVVSPIRFIFTDLGAEVYWNQEEQKVTIRKEENGKKIEIVMKPGSSSMWVNGAEYNNTEIGLDATVLIEDGRCLLPGRAIIKAWETWQFKATHNAPTSYKDYYYRTSTPVDGADNKLQDIPTIDNWQEENPGTKVTEDNEKEVFKPSTSISTDETQIIVDAEITNFKVTVPIKVHASMKKDGSVDTTGTYKVENKCALGPVLISAVKVETASDWKVAAYDADFANMKASSKVIGIAINGAEVGADGEIVLNEDLGEVIRHRGSKDLTFEIRLPAQKKAINELAAAVVFTVAFDKV